MKGRQFNNRELIEGIVGNNSIVLIYIYNNFKQDVVSYIINKGGYTSDADEVFQLALINVKRKLDKKEINIEINLKSYLYKTAIRLWYEYNEDKVKEYEKLNNYKGEKDVVEFEDYYFDIKPSLRIMLRCFELLQKDCQKIFYMQSEGYKYKQIAEEFELSDKYIKTKRKRCYEILLNSYKKTLENEPEQ